MVATKDTTTVYTFEKSNAESIVASLRTFRGKVYADIRTYYWAEPDGGEEHLAPSKKGVSVRLELLPELVRAVQALADAAGESRGTR